MRWIVITLSLAAALSTPCGGAERVRCTTREDKVLKQWKTECTDGSRSVSRYDQVLKQWKTDIVKPGEASKQGGRPHQLGAK
jgi:hypothetical protein